MVSAFEQQQVRQVVSETFGVPVTREHHNHDDHAGDNLHGGWINRNNTKPRIHPTADDAEPSESCLQQTASYSEQVSKRILLWLRLLLIFGCTFLSGGFCLLACSSNSCHVRLALCGRS